MSTSPIPRVQRPADLAAAEVQMAAVPGIHAPPAAGGNGINGVGNEHQGQEDPSINGGNQQNTNNGQEDPPAGQAAVPGQVGQEAGRQPGAPEAPVGQPVQPREAGAVRLEDLRGWLVTVAALFVTLAFEAMLHRPDMLRLKRFSAHGRFAKNETGEFNRALLYLIANVGTFGTALAALLLLLRDNCTLSSVKALMWILSFYLACAFAICASDDWRWTVTVLLFTGFYAAGAAAAVAQGYHESLAKWFREMILRIHPPAAAGPPAARGPQQNP